MTELKKITLSMAIAAAERAALRKGAAFVYISQGGSTCRNVHTDDNGGLVTGCIVGDLMVSEGWIPLDEMPTYSGAHLLNHTLEQYGFVLSGRAEKFLIGVQGLQDNRHPWGDAILRTKKEMGLI